MAALPTVFNAPRGALTASAARLSSRDATAYSKRLSEPWQLQALYHYDVIPELHFACAFLARMLSRVRYYPATLDEDGTLTEIKAGAPVEVLDQIQDPGGGRSQVQFRYGLLQFITGEGLLFGYDEGRKWKFLWKDELRRREPNGDWVRMTTDMKETDEVGVAYRMWTPHPRHSDVPDSPCRAVLDICEELLILTASVRATAVSRITNGMMVLPQELSPNPMVTSRDEDPENNVFLSDYMDHVSHQIENPGSAEARVPFTLEGAYDYVDRIRWMATHDPQTDYLERELRKEAVNRMALGLDMPPEALLGMTDANHWTAKQVMHDMWRSHGVPKAEQLADDLAEAYLRPILRDEGEEWESIVISYDDSQVVISPDRTEIANSALDRIAIGYPAYRELIGVNEDAAPTEEEKELLLSMKLRQPVELDGGDLIIPQRGPIPAPRNGGSPAEGPPDPGTRLTSRQEAQTASGEILGAAQMALLRCREVAGARLRRLSQGCNECGPKIDGVPGHLVAAVLGQAQTGEWSDPIVLVSGAAEGFREVLENFHDIHSAQAKALSQMVEVYAARTLFDATCPQLPSGFVAQVEKAKEVSSALR